MAEQLMTMSYVTPTTRTFAGTTPGTDWLWPGQIMSIGGNEFDNCGVAVAGATADALAGQRGQVFREAKKMADKKVTGRLIRYSVVDPDLILAKEGPPGINLLKTETVFQSGTDQNGFLMELAAELDEVLTAHNTARIHVEYENEKGETRKLKAIRISDLDVVVEVLKEYVE